MRWVLRWQRPLLAAAFVLLLLAAVLGAATGGDSDGDPVRTATGDTSTTTTTRSPKTTTTGSTSTTAPTTTGQPPGSSTTTTTTTTTTQRRAPGLPRNDEPPPTETTTTTTTPEPTPEPTPTTPPCRNSLDPACGPFYWDPPPAANQPLTIKVEPDQLTPGVGDVVTFTVTADDPDQSPIQLCIEYPGEGKCAGPLPRTDGPRYGPWTPPAPAPGHKVEAFTKSFDELGPKTIVVHGWSGLVGPDDPYASHGSDEVTIVVGLLSPPVTEGSARGRVR